MNTNEGLERGAKIDKALAILKAALNEPNDDADAMRDLVSAAMDYIEAARGL